MENQKKNNLSHCGLLFLAAVIWGTAFVAQSAGMEKVGPFTFSSIRFFLGSFALVPVLTFRLKKRLRTDMGDMTGSDVRPNSEKDPSAFRNRIRLTAMAGGICGIILSVAANLQQVAMLDAPAGKAGFLTALYIVLVPILGLFLKKKTSAYTWLGVVVAVVGLYFLCIGREGDLHLQGSDILLLGCALVFAMHILTVDHFNGKGVDGVAVACIQFFVAGVISFPGMLILDKAVYHMPVSIPAIIDAGWPILYAGILSCGVAYTLQIVGQKEVNPTLASLIMSLESVTSVIAGMLILSEKMTTDELIGCTLMFGAILLAQIPPRRRPGSEIPPK